MHAFKRGDVLVMQCLGLTTGLSMPTASEKKAYEDLFEAEPTGSNVKALASLFAGTRVATGKKQRRRKVVA